MELVNTNYCESSFDPTPKLKSSPVPILFVSFNSEDDKCIYCREEYFKTSVYFYGYGVVNRNQKYCKKCLSSYLTDITDKNTYLDVYLYTRNSECDEQIGRASCRERV